MNRHMLVRSALAAAAFVAVAGCSHMGNMMSSSSSSSSSSMQTYTATLSPSEEVPPAADSQGKGTAEIHVDT